MKIDASKACPRSLGNTSDVSNDFPQRAGSLLPPDEQPRSALLCGYSATSNGASTTVLSHSVRLRTAQAQHLAAAVRGVSLAPAKGVFSCPADFFGSVTLIAFAYRGHRTAALWYKTSGCRTLDNGHVLAFQGANPSFYNRFESVVAAVAPTP